MTQIYDTPVRPWAFGPLIGTDIVARQAEALVQRYDLLDALAAGGCARRDLDPASAADSRLREVIATQLVPWVDYVPDDTNSREGDREPSGIDDGWPIPQGVRLEALCYSPWLDALRASDGTIGGKQVFALPDSAEEFARQFYLRSGIQVTRLVKPIRTPGLDQEIQHGFRFTPLVVGEVAMRLRYASVQSERAFRLLMSRHFEEACDEDERLRAPHPLLQACGFDGDAVVAFERLAELTRIGMIVREVERHAQTGRRLHDLLERANAPKFVAANAIAPGVAYSREIAAALAGDPPLLTLCEYLAVGTDVLASWRNAVVADRGTFHEGFRPAAVLSGGTIASDTAAALAWMVDVRTAFLSAFRTPTRAGPGSRQSALDNDILFKFYGLTNFHANLASTLIADFMAVRPDGAPRKTTRKTQPDKKSHPDDVRTSLAEIANRIGGDGRVRGAGINAIREGAWLTKVALPERGQHGSAARSDDSLWRDRYRDQPFWARFQDADVPWYAQLSMRPADRQALRAAFRDLQSLAAGLTPWAPSPLTARAVADLATAVSPISVNPAFGLAIRKLVRFNGLIARATRTWSRLSPGRHRRIEQMRETLGDNALGLREVGSIRGLSARFEDRSGKRRRRADQPG